MENMVPTRVFLTKGVGRHKYQLKSFEEALRKAGVAQQNLVQVSSILPPKCRIISRSKGLDQLTPGEVCFCVMARADTNEHGTDEETEGLRGSHGMSVCHLGSRTGERPKKPSTSTLAEQRVYESAIALQPAASRTSTATRGLQAAHITFR